MTLDDLFADRQTNSCARILTLGVKALKDEAYSVREAIAIALGEIGPATKKAVPALIERLSDSEAQVRDAAKQALKAIAEE